MTPFPLCQTTCFFIPLVAPCTPMLLNVEVDSQAKEIVWNQLLLTSVQGNLVNGRGKELVVDTQGILLLDVLKYADVPIHTEVTVITEDAYRAVVTSQEGFAEGQVYWVVQDDGGVQLVVFGDSNSKRNVSDVKQLVVS